MKLNVALKRLPLGVWLVTGLAVILIGITVLLLRMPGNSPSGFEQYEYNSFNSALQVKLHVMKTSPANVSLSAVNANVTDTPYFGINGGFFYDGALLSIAVMNDRPALAAAGYGSGDENTKYARGTLVWDGRSQRFHIQVARKAAELTVADRTQYWAQGGISMNLGDDAGWRSQIQEENMPFPDDMRLRTAAVYDETEQLYLIVTDTKTTAEAFRRAIQELGSELHFVDGIFLDGDGSSQMRCSEAVLPGDRRMVVQMIRLLQ